MPQDDPQEPFLPGPPSSRGKAGEFHAPGAQESPAGSPRCPPPSCPPKPSLCLAPGSRPTGTPGTQLRTAGPGASPGSIPEAPGKTIPNEFNLSCQEVIVSCSRNCGGSAAFPAAAFPAFRLVLAGHKVPGRAAGRLWGQLLSPARSPRLPLEREERSRGRESGEVTPGHPRASGHRCGGACPSGHPRVTTPEPRVPPPAPSGAPRLGEAAAVVGNPSWATVSPW